jgi:hypothetical protein
VADGSEPDALWREIEGAVTKASSALDPGVYRFAYFLVRAALPEKGI